MNIKRREFIKRSAIGAGGLLLGAQLGAAENPAAAKFHDPYALVPLGKTGFEIFPRLHGHRHARRQPRIQPDAQRPRRLSEIVARWL